MDNSKKKITTIERNGIRMDFDVSGEETPKPVIAYLNVFGFEIEMDLSEEAEKERQKERELDEENQWTKGNGDRLNSSELKLINCYTAHKLYSPNGAYCLVYDKGFNVESLGKIWLIDCGNKQIIYSYITNVINDVFLVDSGIVVINHFKRDPVSFITVYDQVGTKIFQKTKKLYLEISGVSEEGEITGHYLDEKYSKFTFKPI